MSINKPMIGLLLIATRKYNQFVDAIVDQAKKYFFPDHPVTIFIFSDHAHVMPHTDRVTIQTYPIPPYEFPYATLYRYKIFDQHIQPLSRMAYLFYSDVDMAFVDVIDDSILCDGLTCVFHPGFFRLKSNPIENWGSNNVDQRSTAWVSPLKRFNYVAGGFNGGRTDDFLSMCRKLNLNIDKDEEMGVMAEYHDESHLNAYLKNEYNISNANLKLLSPAYCMVEQQNLRKKWGIDEIKPKIIALAKNHAEIRS